MNDALLVILSITGFLAIYWVLFGQWKYNRMMEDKPVEEAPETEETKKNESDKT